MTQNSISKLAGP